MQIRVGDHDKAFEVCMRMSTDRIIGGRPKYDYCCSITNSLPEEVETGRRLPESGASCDSLMPPVCSCSDVGHLGVSYPSLFNSAAVRDVGTSRTESENPVLVQVISVQLVFKLRNGDHRNVGHWNCCTSCA
jgi:hypothetical protein